VPEQPVAVITDDELGRLLSACTGNTFEIRRDTAIIRLLLGSQPPPGVPNDISFTEDELLCIVFWIPPRRYVLTAITDGRINHLGSTD
jgi:hypothetical protein